MAPRTSNVVGSGGEIDIDIAMRAGTQAVTAASIQLDFDPRLLQIVSFGAPTGGGSNPFPVALLTEISNTLGQARYDAGASFGSLGPSGYFRAATVRVKPTTDVIASGRRMTTAITLSRSGSRATSLTGYVGADLSELIRNTSGATIGINPSASSTTIVASATPVSLPVGIETALSVYVADWTNAPLSGATFSIDAVGSGAVMVSPSCGTTGVTGALNFVARPTNATGLA
jgi:hypothetical protein